METNGFNIIPEYFQKADLLHFSPSQLNLPIDVWLHKYIFKNKEWRDQQILHPRVPAGSAAEKGFLHYILEEEDQGAAVKVARTEFKKNKVYYVSHWNADYEKCLDTLEKVVANAIAGFREIGEVKNCTTQEDCEFHFKGIDVTCQGKTDILTSKYVIELKTKWRKPGTPCKVTKRTPDGMTSGIVGSLPKTSPPIENLKQVSFYSKATGKEPIIIYANDIGHRVFDKNNCNKMTPSFMEHYIEFLRINQKVRQNFLKISTNPRVLAQYIQPDFSAYQWNDLDEDQFEEAVGLWKNI